MIFCFFQSFPLPFPLLAKVFSFQSISFLVSFIWNSQKWPVSQNIWCLIKTQLKNITQTIFQGGSPWATLIQNSVVCLEGTLLCPAAFLRSWFFDFFQSFPLPFPLLAKVFSFQSISFLVSFIWNSQKWPVSQNIWCLIKTQLKTSLKQFFKGVVHEQPWYRIVWQCGLFGGYTIVSSCFPEAMIFWFFQSFPLPFPLLKFFSFNCLITFLVSFIWNSQKCPVSQNIWCLIKTQLKNITQTIFQGGSPWATLIHNSVVCLEGTLLCPAASWGYVFFQPFPFPFPLLKFFSFMVFLWYYY